MKIPEEKSRAIGTALILIALTIVFGSILAWMYSVNLLIIPDGLARILGISTDGDGDELMLDTSLAGVIRNERSEDRASIGYELDYENLRAALLSETALDGYMLKMRVRYPSAVGESNEVSLQTAADSVEVDEQSLTEETEQIDENAFTDISIYRSGEKFRVERYNARGELKELEIFNSYAVYHYDPETEASRSVPRSDGVSPENAAGLPSVTELLEIVRQFSENTVEYDEIAEKTTEPVVEADGASPISPLEEDATEAENFVRYTDGAVELAETELGNLYFVGYFDTLLGTREEYFLSLKYNVIMSQCIWHGDELLYSSETIEFSVDPEDWSDTALYEP